MLSTHLQTVGTCSLLCLDELLTQADKPNCQLTRLRSGHHPTCLRNRVRIQLQGHQLWEQRGRPTASVTEERRQRQNHAHRCPRFTCAQGVSRQNMNYRGCQPIRSWRCRCVHCAVHALAGGFCGYIKRVQLGPSHSD